MTKRKRKRPLAGRRAVWTVGAAAVALVALASLALLRIDMPSPPTRTPPHQNQADTAPSPGENAGEDAALPAPQTGTASWYDFSDQKTANGETMDEDDMTAAHPSLPFGTRLRVENVENGRTVVVRVNDRGPYEAGRIIDLSEKAAEKLGIIKDGVAKVRITEVKRSP